MAAQLLYIIHAADDRALADFLKSQCEAHVPELRAFVASKAGQIPTGADWLSEVHRNLRAATAFLLLLTPGSLERFWVWYEAGAAWMSTLPRWPVAAGGLDPGKIPLPLGINQTQNLEDPSCAVQLFTDLGGVLPEPEAFCAVVRTLGTLSPRGLDQTQLQAIRQAFGGLGDPPKMILRRMLSSRAGFTLHEMGTELSANGYPGSDAIYVERVRNALKDAGFIESDEGGRWRITQSHVRALDDCFDPPLSRRLLELARDMRAWGQGQQSRFDGNGYREKFQTRLDLLREKAGAAHAQGDPWLSRIPSGVAGVEGIAAALTEVAKHVP